MARVLVIEDDLDTRELLTRYLTIAGHETTVAANGSEGLLTLERGADLVLLDLMMPGMDGFTFLNALRHQKGNTEIPVLAVTALDPADVLSKLRPLGVTHVLSKGAGLMRLLVETVDEQVAPRDGGN